MKKLLVAIIALAMGVAAFAQDGRSIYSKYSDKEGVDAVYISPAMFRIVRRLPEVDTGSGSLNLSKIIRSMKGFYVINTDSPRIAESLYEDVDKFVKKGKYELLLEAKENGEVTRIYTVGDEKVVTSFVLLSREPDETSFIAFDGKIDREKLEEAIADAAQ